MARSLGLGSLSVGPFAPNPLAAQVAPFFWLDGQEAARVLAIRQKIARRPSASKRSGLPNPPPNLDGPLRDFLIGLREQIEVRDAQRGSPLDASPTFMDLINSGVIQDNGLTVAGRKFSLDQIRNLISSTVPDWVTNETAPPTAAGVVVSSLPAGILIRWNDISVLFSHYGQTEVWRATVNNLSQAIKIDWGAKAETRDALPPPGTVYHYWVRHLSKNGIAGAFQSVSGVSWTDKPNLIPPGDVRVTVSDGLIELEWPEPASNLDIKYYLIYRLDAQGDPITPAIGRSNTNWYEYRPSALGDYRFGVMPIALGGTEPALPVAEDMTAATLAVVALAAPSPLTWQVVGGKLELAWGTPAAPGAGFALALSGYEIWAGAVGTGTLVQQLGAFTNKYRIPATIGTTTYSVVAVDSAGLRGAAASVVATLTVAAAPGVTVGIVGEDLQIAWNTPASLLPLAEYEVRYGDGNFDWTAGTALPRIAANATFVRPGWAGAKTFKVRAYDIEGRAGEIGAAEFSIATQAAPTAFRAEVVDNNVLLYWTAPVGGASTLPIRSFEIRKGAVGASWANATEVGTKQGSFTTVFETTAGTFRYFIAAVDSGGTAGAVATLTAQVSQPPDYVLVDQMVEPMAGRLWDFADGAAGWTTVAATLTAAEGGRLLAATGADPGLVLAAADLKPDNRQYCYGCEWPSVRIKVRRVAGSGSDAGDGYGYVYYRRYDANGANYRDWSASYRARSDVPLPAAGAAAVLSFDLAALTVGGNDWLLSRIDGLRFDLGAGVGDDFVIEWIQALPFAASNLLPDGRGARWVGPFNHAEQYDTHFASRGWATPDAQIAAGYDYFLEPSQTAAYLEKIIDLGTTLPAMRVAALLDTVSFDGAVTLTPKISLSNTSAVAGFTDYDGQSVVFGSSFRWVKLRWTLAASGGDDVLAIDAFTTKLDIKKKNDSGGGTANAADVGGTTVNFNQAFAEVTAIGVTASGTSPLMALYDFVDAPNPTSFKVLLFNTSGVRASGNFSWSANGY